MLCARSVRIEFAFFRGGFGAGFALSKSLHVIPKEKRGNQSSDDDRYQRVHGRLEEPHHEHESHVKQSKQSEGIAERLVNHVPEMKNLLRTGKKQDSLRKRCLFLCHGDGLFEVAMPRFKKTTTRRELLGKRNHAPAQACDT